MAVLLDTNAFIWWLVDQSRLRRAVHMSVWDHENDIFVSAATATEMTTKHRLGKLLIVDSFVGNLVRTVHAARFQVLNVEFANVITAGQLPFAHFDNLQ